MIKALTVFGTRPEAIKMAPIVRELRARAAQFSAVVVVTAQHREMLDQVLNLFFIEPDYDLDIMLSNQTLPQVTSRVLLRLGKVLEREKPDIVLVQGDTTTTFAVALAAFYQRIPIGHVEAGLRTYDKFHPYPEEINRCLTTVLADFHFAPTDRARENLLHEGVRPDRIFVTGNPVIDALLETIKSDHQCITKQLEADFSSYRTVLVTAHRRESWGKPLKNICLAIKRIVERYPDVQVVFPIHLNPRVRNIVLDLLGGEARVHLTDPLDYELFVHLMSQSYLILTDSGGIQEEAPSLGKPVLVLREVTERPEAVEAGTAKVVGTEAEAIIRETSRLLDDRDEYNRMAKAINPYGDGNAAKRIVDILATKLGS